MNNSNVIEEWLEIGGVLGYDYERNGVVSLYIMDDGEFDDRWKDQYKFYSPVDSEITREDFARLLCKTSLERAGCTEKETEELMNW